MSYTEKSENEYRIQGSSCNLLLVTATKGFENRFGYISSGHGSKTDMILNAIDGSFGEFRISDLEAACPTVSRDMIRHVLFRLRDEKKIKVVGKGRSSKWEKLVEKMG